MGPKDIIRDIMRREGVSVTIFKGQGEKVSVKALKNKFNGIDCFQFLPEDNINVEQGDILIQDLTGDEWDITTVRSETAGGEVICKIANIALKGDARRLPSVVQHINFEGATIGALAVGGNEAFAWGNACVTERRDEILDILNEILGVIRTDESISEDDKHDLQADVEGIVNELKKRKPLAEVLLQYVGHLSNIASITTLAHKFGELLANIGFR